MNKLLQFLQCPSGRFSSNRLLYLVGSLGILTIWAVKTLRSDIPYELPESIVYIFASLQGAKIWQNYSEKQKANVIVPNTETK
jgi:hypothetical protein